MALASHIESRRPSRFLPGLGGGRRSISCGVSGSARCGACSDWVGHLHHGTVFSPGSPEEAFGPFHYMNGAGAVFAPPFFPIPERMGSVAGSGDRGSAAEPWRDWFSRGRVRSRGRRAATGVGYLGAAGAVAGTSARGERVGSVLQLGAVAIGSRAVCVGRQLDRERYRSLQDDGRCMWPPWPFLASTTTTVGGARQLKRGKQALPIVNRSSPKLSTASARLLDTCTIYRKRNLPCGSRMSSVAPASIHIRHRLFHAVMDRAWATRRGLSALSGRCRRRSRPCARVAMRSRAAAG